MLLDAATCVIPTSQSNGTPRYKLVSSVPELNAPLLLVESQTLNCKQACYSVFFFTILRFDGVGVMFDYRLHDQASEVRSPAE
jgi:hypothetical protein